MSENKHSSNPLDGAAGRAGVLTLLLVQIVVGYEWLTSGITKVASGDFVSGLAADLKDGADSAPGFYRSFLHGTIIPNARTFAVFIEIGEILVGVAFIAAAVFWIARWSKLSDRWRVSILVATMLAALGATFMAINFHLANGGNHPWLIPKDGFDETIDVDTVLVFVQAAYFVFSGYVLLRIRRAHQASTVPDEVHGAVPAAS